MDWGGRTFLRRCAHSPVNETKEAIVAVMYAFGRPVTEQELQKVWGTCKRPEILAYHLRTLLEMRVVELVHGPELHYGLVGVGEAGVGPGFQEGMLQGPTAVTREEEMPRGTSAFDKRSNQR
jgi:hypothetical protein